MHESYPDGKPVALQAIISLETVRDRNHYLMLKFEECRRPDNADLYIWYLRTWTDGLLYDGDTSNYVLNDPERGRNHAGHKKLRWMLALLETIRRERESLQEDDKADYHAKDADGNLITIKEHRCILADEIQMVLAEIREKAYRENFSKRKSIMI